jgi:hypothetical protein
MAKFFYYPFATSGNIATTPDATQINGSVSYNQGYPIDYQLPLASNPSAIPISRAQMNGLFNDITGAILQIQSQGVFTWIGPSTDSPPLYTGNFPYPINALVYYMGVVYQSATAANTDTPGTTANWVQLAATPAGSYLELASTTVPAGYLACDGTSHLVATYPALFAAIGYLYGGSGANFSVPPSARMGTVGSGGSPENIYSGLQGTTVGSTGGEETHLMQETELVQHFHSIPTGTGGSGGCAVFNLAPNGLGETGITPAIAAVPFNITQPSMVVLRCIKF